MESSSKRRKKEEEEEEVEVDDELVVDDDGTAAASRSRDGLVYTLVQRLQVCRPALVLRKLLVRSYLSRRQNYLGITRAEYARGFAPLLTGEERGCVRRGGGGGLPVRALDRRGAEYRMVLARLEKTYRGGAGSSATPASGRTTTATGTSATSSRSGRSGRRRERPIVLLHYTKEEDAQMTVAAAVASAEEEAYSGHVAKRITMAR